MPGVPGDPHRTQAQSTDVIDGPSGLFVPTSARSSPPRRGESGSWPSAQGPRSPSREAHWEDGHGWSFRSQRRGELLDGDIFYSLAAAKVIIEGWRRCDNAERPHSAPGYHRHRRP